MSEALVDVLNPVSPRREGAAQPAPRHASLSGLTIGFLHNGKPGAPEIVDAVMRELNGKFKDIRFEYRRKAHPASGAPFIAGLEGRWDAAIVALGD